MNRFRTMFVSKSYLLVVTVAVTAVAGCADQSANRVVDSGPNRNVNEWDIPRASRLAIDGYDPVAYFPEGGSAPMRGCPEFEYEYRSVRYRFATAKNMQRFRDNPARYEPAHGGWCSWAMIDGDKTEANPESYIVKDNRLFLFYDGAWGDTRAAWLEADHDASAAKADENWKRISGEEKRTTPNK